MQPLYMQHTEQCWHVLLWIMQMIGGYVEVIHDREITDKNLSRKHVCSNKLIFSLGSQLWLG